MTRADRIRIEALKLLVEVAWADHEIADAEADYLIGLAVQANASDAELDELRRSLADERRLTAPDLAVLRAHRDDVLRAIDDLIAIDDRIVRDEVAARAAIRALLDRA
jgi:hypothetical protein